MTNALVGQPIADIIVIRDDSNTPVVGLTSADFTALEAFALMNPLTTALVSLVELGLGQYRVVFTPPVEDTWVLHWVYDVSPIFREEERRYTVKTSAAQSLTASAAGGTWTYAADFTLQRDRVRRLIPDVDPEDPLLSDQEMAMFLTGDDSTRAQDYRVAADCCEAIADGLPDVSAENTVARFSQTNKFWMDKAKRYRERAAKLAYAVPYAGGISYGDVNNRLADPDRIPLASEPRGILLEDRQEIW
jgi:hypothetical protein